MEIILPALAAMLCIVAPGSSLSSNPGVCGNQATEFFCSSDSRCIPRAWTCDGSNDCSDGEDEERNLCSNVCTDDQHQCQNATGSSSCISKQRLCDGECHCRVACDDESRTLCGNRTCAAGEFSCGDGQCISSQWKCDGQDDCLNKADEDPRACRASLNCSKHEFACADGQRCIAAAWKCDGQMECADGSDEAEATCSLSPTDRACPRDQFACLDGFRCLPMRWKCDGDTDCRDGSDENETMCSGLSSARPPTRCSNYEFTCSDGECISGTYRCDGDIDCLDRSDEMQCNKTCGAGYFQCRDVYQCIPSAMQCDGRHECSDHTDESGCPVKNRTDCDRTTQFNCTADHTECISNSNVCNGHADCWNQADEEPAMCQIVDICLVNKGGCNSTCTPNANGRTRLCGCYPGFKLAPDEVSCHDIDECEERPGACSHKCINTVGSFVCDCLEGYALDPAHHSLCKAIGERPFLVFANRIDIRQLRLSKLAEYSVLVDEGKSIVAMDIDSSTNTIYYSDSGRETIASASFPETVANKTLISSDVQSVDGLAFDWIYKRIYWTDAGNKTISAASTNNPTEDRIVLVDGLSEPRAIALYPRKGWMFFSDWGNKKIYSAGMNGDSMSVIIDKHVEWPNGLAIDMVKETLYWIDAKLKSIQMANFDGSEQRVIVADGAVISHPFAITVFEDSLYWSDWTHQRIVTANKFTGSDIKVLLNESSALTTPMDIKVNHPLRQPDGVNHCMEIPERERCAQLCYPAPQLTAASNKVSCRCRAGFSLNDDLKSCTPLGGQGGTVADVRSSPAAENFSTGLIAAVCSALTLLAVAVTAVIILRRRYSRKTAKRTANFDNPVYGKTTEDRITLRLHEHTPSRTTPPAMVPLTSKEDDANYDLNCDYNV